MKIIERYREWNRHAYLSRFERRLNRTLWGLLIVGVVYAALQHVVLANVPEVFRTGARWGDLFYGLAIGYIGAFAFYLLNIRLPLRRDRQAIYRNIGPVVGLVVMHANEMLVSLNKAAGIEPPDRENTWPNVQELCSKIGPQSPVGGLYVATNSGLASHTVFSVIVDRMNHSRAGIDKILSFSSFLASDLIDLLLAIETHSHFRSFSQQVMIVQHTGIPIGGKDLSVSAPQIFNYVRLIRELDDYGKEFLPMTYEARPDLPDVEITSTPRSTGDPTESPVP